jgi:transcriptional regulator with XRE-family HTH domain
MNTLGIKISDARKAKGFTQEELAELAKVNLRTIQRIENAESIPRSKTLILLCDALDIDLEDVLIKEDRKKVNIGALLINILFLAILNLVLISIFGYLTIGGKDSASSAFGAVLLSFFLSFFLVWLTPNMNGQERFYKFGLGHIFFLILVFFNQGFSIGVTSMLFPSLVISLAIFYFGNTIIKLQPAHKN